MDDWSTKTVRRLLDGRSSAARLRFLGSTKDGRIDLYFKDTVPSAAADLMEIGWRCTATLTGLPDGIRGRVYIHHSINARCRRRTRALLLRCMDRSMPTAAVPKLLEIEAAIAAAPMLALPAPPKLLALPPPDWMRNVPVKLRWSHPQLYEIGRIKPASPHARLANLRFRTDADQMLVHSPRSYWGVIVGDRHYSFYNPVTFSVAHYFVEVDRRRVVLGAIDGEFADEAWAYADPEEAAKFAGVWRDGRRVPNARL